MDFNNYIPNMVVLTTPKIKTDVYSCTEVELNEAIATYEEDVASYTESYRSANKRANESKKQFMLESGYNISNEYVVAINFHNNKYNCATFIEELLTIASEGKSLTTKTSLNEIYNYMEKLYNNLLVAGDVQLTKLSEPDESSSTFDAEPFVFGENSGTEYTSSNYFIRSNFGLNKEETKQVYNLYNESNSIVATIKYDAKTNLWKLYEVTYTTSDQGELKKETPKYQNKSISTTGWTKIVEEKTN